MPILEAKMLQKSILEPHFLHKALLEPKWDHHPAAKKLFLRISGAPGGRQNSQKSIKMSAINYVFFGMPPGRPPGGFWEPNWSLNHQTSFQKWSRKS